MFRKVNFLSYLDVRADDPDTQRRGRLLNIILFGLVVITIAGLIGSLFLGVDALLYGVGGAFLLGAGIIYALNRRGKIYVASIIFIALLILVFSFGDIPEEVVDGHTLFLFVIPILISSAILFPSASFVTAGVVDIVLVVLSVNMPDAQVSNITLVGFFGVAIISWLMGRTLEDTLRELRESNRVLDQRVEERTAELANAVKELATTNAQLETANDQLTQLDRLKDKFVADVTHELRTPISVLKIYAEMIEEKPKKFNTYFTIIQEQIEKLHDLIEQILSLARADRIAERAENIVKDDVDIIALVTDVVAGEKASAAVKEIDLAFYAERSSYPMFVGHREQLTQVIQNLVSNAIKYTPDRGKVEAWLTYDEDGAVPQIVFQVQDTGLGIAQDETEHIFSRFYRGSNVAQSDIPGTGLGLSLVQEIVKGHGGIVEVESELGKGSTFTIKLPVEA